MGMMLLMCLCLAGVSADVPRAGVETVRRLAPPPAPLSMGGTLSVAADADGGVYALDVVQRTLFIWDAEGAFVRTLGRRGEGPGEMTIADGLASVAVSARTIMVLDSQARKVHLWDRTYQYLKSVPFQGVARVIALHPLGDGFLISTSDHRAAHTRLEQLNAAFEPQAVWYTVAGCMYAGNTHGGWDYRPYAPRLLTAFRGDRIWVADSSTRAVHRLTAPDHVAATLRAPIPPRPITDTDRANCKRRFDRWAGSNDRLVFAEEINPIDALFCLNEGVLVVSYQQEPESLLQGLLFDPDTGTLKARLTYGFPEGSGVFYPLAGNLLRTRETAEGDFELSIDRLTVPTH